MAGGNNAEASTALINFLGTPATAARRGSGHSVARVPRQGTRNSRALALPNVSSWHEPDLQRCLQFGRYPGESGHGVDCPIRSR